MTIENKPQQAPIRQALGQQWPSLGNVIRRHYDLPPHTETNLEVDGVMDVVHSPIGKLFITAGRLFDALVPYRGRGITVTVQNWSTSDSSAMFWHRTFRFTGKEPVIFQSRMEYAGKNDIVEKYGLGIRMTLSAEGESLRYESQGYQWDLGPLKLQIPDWLLLGKAIK